LLKPFIKKEFKLELRRKSVIAGLSLYLVCIAFIYYLAIGLNQQVLTPLVWSALFWSTLLFSAINTIAKSFIGEKKGLEIYYYSIMNPQAFITSKMVYNSILSVAMGLFGYGLFATLLTNPIRDIITFLLTLTLASLGFASSLTLVSGLAAKANNSNVLMAVLSFPVVISILLIAIKATKNCIDGLDRASSYDELTTLFAINCLVGAVSYLLFPYIWRN
jgi:heme exporter protein B